MLVVLALLAWEGGKLLISSPPPNLSLGFGISRAPAPEWEWKKHLCFPHSCWA